MEEQTWCSGEKLPEGAWPTRIAVSRWSLQPVMTDFKKSSPKGRKELCKREEVFLQEVGLQDGALGDRKLEEEAVELETERLKLEKTWLQQEEVWILGG